MRGVRMKVLIDIPEDIYENRDDEDYIKMCAEEISTAFRNGIPIPDNATNVDVIRTLFPDGIPKDIVWTLQDDKGADWWSSPYQKGGKK